MHVSKVGLADKRSLGGQQGELDVRQVCVPVAMQRVIVRVLEG